MMFSPYIPFRDWLAFRSICQRLYNEAAQVAIVNGDVIVAIHDYDPDRPQFRSPPDQRLIFEAAAVGVFLRCDTWEVQLPTDQSPVWSGAFSPAPGISTLTLRADMWNNVIRALVQEFLYPDLPAPAWATLLEYFQHYRKHLQSDYFYLEALAAPNSNEARNFRQVELAHHLAEFIGTAARSSGADLGQSNYWLRLVIWKCLQKPKPNPNLLHLIEIARRIKASPGYSPDLALSMRLAITLLFYEQQACYLR